MLWAFFFEWFPNFTSNYSSTLIRFRTISTTTL